MPCSTNWLDANTSRLSAVVAARTAMDRGSRDRERIHSACTNNPNTRIVTAPTPGERRRHPAREPAPHHAECPRPQRIRDDQVLVGEDELLGLAGAISAAGPARWAISATIWTAGPA